MRMLSLLVLAAAVAACTSERPPAPGDDAVATPPAQAPVPDAAPPVPATPGPASVPPQGDDGQASFVGYGDAKFGIAAADMEAAWGGELNEVGKDFNPNCYFMTPLWVKTPSEFNFMISDGKFARVGTDSGKFAAPGGGKVGMAETELQALYDNGLQASPHEYTDGKYLSISASGVAPTKLVFETDGKAVVTEWRVGVTPEVDYVEGCS